MANYELKMTRAHETVMVTKSYRDETLTFELPLRETLIVAFSCEEDPFLLEEEALVALAAQAAPVNPAMPSEGWGPWRACMLREQWEFPAPEPLCITPDSPAGRLLAESLSEYVSLYGTDEFAPYRVLEHWFCTIGNGLDWRRDGTLSDGLTPAQRKKQREMYRRSSPGPEPTAQDREDQRVMMWDMQPCIGSPVHLYPLSPGYSKVFNLPADIEDSFLVAAMQLLRYLLSRPIWENSAYSARDLLTLRDGSGCPDFKESDIWRQVTLADGAKYRALLEQAYSQMVLGPWGPRLKAMGFEDKSFHPLDYRLPPRAKSYAKGR